MNLKSKAKLTNLLIAIFFIDKCYSYLRSNLNIVLNKRSQNVLQSSKIIENEVIDVDVCIIGGGIAGSTISWLLQEREQCKVALVDPRVNTPGTWYPNYGEWRDEWHALSERLKFPELKECTTTEWERTDCFFGGSNDIPMEERTILDRPYVRVDRIKMQALLRKQFSAANGVSIASKLSSRRISANLFDKALSHHADGSIVTLDNGVTVNCKVLIDTSGLESRLVSKEEPFLARGSEKELPTGYQIAYGFIANVNSLGPYNEGAMTLFDYRYLFVIVIDSNVSRTDHFNDSTWLRDGEDRPTFMYAMPLSRNSDGTFRVFWEETSLVGRGSRRLSFAECKGRAMRRLEYHGIKVFGVEEEEYCYIPMGGELPDLTQRVVGFGGAANMVHPSTGYHACRMLAAATDLSVAIGDGIRSGRTPDQISADAYRTLWNKRNRGQRDFQAFGGDFLMEQKVQTLRGFFSAFFSVDKEVWAGFLAGWPGLPGNIHHETWDRRFAFALNLFLKMPNDVRISIISYAIKYTFEYGPNTLLRSLTPDFLFGSGPPDFTWEPPKTVFGDEEAKSEARTMIKKFAEENIKIEEKIESDNSYPAPFN